MLKQGSPFLWGVVIPLTVLAAVTLIPYIFPKPTKDELGKWFPRHNRLAQIFFILILLVIGILTIVDLLPVS
jgi:polyferredoxin